MESFLKLGGMLSPSPAGRISPTVATTFCGNVGVIPHKHTIVERKILVASFNEHSQRSYIT